MAANAEKNNPSFAYTIIYTEDVEKAVEFYHKAFGFQIRRLDRSRRWAELETGGTTLAFTPKEQHETSVTGGVETPMIEGKRQNIEVCFTVDDINKAFKAAVEAGAIELAKPEIKNWGQTVGYLKDPEGITIRLGSHVVA